MTTDAQSAYQEIFDTIVPEAIEFFKAKTRDYSGGPAFMLLGTRGQFADINRKFWKLYAALWEGKPLEGEQPDEIVRDFIGHCFLTLYCLKHEGDPVHTEDHYNGDDDSIWSERPQPLLAKAFTDYASMPDQSLFHLMIQRGLSSHDHATPSRSFMIERLTTWDEFKDDDRG